MVLYYVSVFSHSSRMLCMHVAASRCVCVRSPVCSGGGYSLFDVSDNFFFFVRSFVRSSKHFSILFLFCCLLRALLHRIQSRHIQWHLSDSSTVKSERTKRAKSLCIPLRRTKITFSFGERQNRQNHATRRTLVPKMFVAPSISEIVRINHNGSQNDSGSLQSRLVDFHRVTFRAFPLENSPISHTNMSDWINAVHGFTETKKSEQVS